jgi:hypothetical protein
MEDEKPIEPLLTEEQLKEFEIIMDEEIKPYFETPKDKK